MFSKIDLNQGYQKILLHSASQPLTTFFTHVGLFRYKCLNFGLSCAAEIFQKKVRDAILGIPSVKNMRDHIYITQPSNAGHAQMDTFLAAARQFPAQNFKGKHGKQSVSRKIYEKKSVKGKESR